MIIDGITLSDSFTWENEFAWSPVGQTQDRSVTGAFLVQEQLKQYGREIDLIGGEDAVWHTKAVVQTLKDKEELLNYDFPVTLPDGQVFQCMFNRESGGAVEARQVMRFDGVPGPDTTYTILKIRLITVEP